MAPALSAALTVWFCSSCCRRREGTVTGPGRTGLAPWGWRSPHLCDRALTPLAQHVWLSASCPAPHPAGRRGPLGVGEGLGDHMTPRQGQPAAWLPARPMAHCRAAISTRLGMARPPCIGLAGGRGGTSVQQALMEPRWEPGAGRAPTGFMSSAPCCQTLQTAASDLGA